MRKYNLELLKIMSLFEKVTRTRLKDCFFDDNDLLTFVVDAPYLGKAIGKRAANVKKLENLLKKKIKIVGFTDSPEKFVENLIYPIKAEVVKVDNLITIKGPDTKSKAILIGRNQSNLKNYKNIVNKYFKDIELKVA